MTDADVPSPRRGEGTPPPPPPPPPPGAGNPPSHIPRRHASHHSHHAPKPASGPPPTPRSAEGRTLLPELGLYQDRPWRRVAARAIDWGLLAIPALLVRSQLLVTECRYGGGAVTCGTPGWRFVIAGLLTAAVVTAYFIGLTWFLGATPGKLAMRLAVITSDGLEPDLETAALRGAIDGAIAIVLVLPFDSNRWACVILAFLVSAACAVLLVERSRQVDLYDLLADTYVVRR